MKDIDHILTFEGMIGVSPSIRGVFHKIEVYGPADASVVITGETGTGKELVARALHKRSPRQSMPFVAVNCSALSEELFESELFGHERGSFTGAIKTHRGRFERADRGTLFLDEIGDMPIRIQAKLLRTLEEGIIERVGGEEEYPINVRIIAATNISLEQALAVGRFRADLYHRLSVFRVHIPPLRRRPGDIELLVNHFLKVLNHRYNRDVQMFTPDALGLLEEYHWPGNVRELRNVLERVYVETRGRVIGYNAFKEWIKERDYFSAGGWDLYQLENQKATKPAIIVPNYPYTQRLPNITEIDPYRNHIGLLPYDADSSLPKDKTNLSIQSNPHQVSGNPPIDIFYTKPAHLSTKPEITKEILLRAYKNTKGNITQAARLLGIHKATFYRYMKTMGLTRESLNNTPI